MPRVFAGLISLAAVTACGPREPEIHRLFPAEGGITGGQLVRIEGVGFAGRGPAEVFFGQKAAKGITVEGAYLITAVAPIPDGEGAVEVQIRFPDGELLAAPEQFVYEEVAGMRIDITPFGARSVPATD